MAERFLYIDIPETAVNEDAAVKAWIQDNLAVAVNTEFLETTEMVRLQLNSAGIRLLTPQKINKALEVEGIFSGNPHAIVAEVNTSILNANVPTSYYTNSGYDPEVFSNAHQYNSGGTMTAQKKVSEFLLYTEGTSGKSLLYCAEIPWGGTGGTGLQHDELIRFKTYFGADYFVATEEQITTWKANNT